MNDQPLPPSTEPEPSSPADPAAPEAEAPPAEAAPAEAAPAVGWIQPPSDQKPRRVLPIILAIVGIGVVAIVGLLVFIGANTDPRDVAAANLGRRLIEMPEFQARYGEVDTPEEAYQLGQELGLTAIAKLDDANLGRYWELTQVMLQNADDSICTQVLRQTIESEGAEELVRSLDVDQFQELTDITFRAFEAELKGTAAPPAPSEADVQNAYVALADAMGADQMTQAATTLGDTTADDATMCNAGRAFLDGVLALEEPHRAALLRFMVSP